MLIDQDGTLSAGQLAEITTIVTGVCTLATVYLRLFVRAEIGSMSASINESMSNNVKAHENRDDLTYVRKDALDLKMAAIESRMASLDSRISIHNRTSVTKSRRK